MSVGAPKTGNPLIDQVLKPAFDLLNRLERILLPRDKRIVVPFAAAGTDTLVRHGLGHPVEGMIDSIRPSSGIVSQGGALVAPYTPDQYINLRWSGSVPASVTVIFW